MTSRHSVPFSFGSLERSFSWSNGWLLPSFRAPGFYLGEFCKRKELMEPNEHLELQGLERKVEHSQEVAITPQENPSRRSSVFGSLMTSRRRLSVPFPQAPGWLLPSLRAPGFYPGEFCISLSRIFSHSIFSCFQSLRNRIGKSVMIVCGISCALLVVFSWPAIKFFFHAHVVPLKIMFMNVRIVHRLLLNIS